MNRYTAAARLYAQTEPLTRRDGNLVKNPLRQFARELGSRPRPGSALRIEPERALNSLTADIGLPPRLQVVGGIGDV